MHVRWSSGRVWQAHEWQLQGSVRCVCSSCCFSIVLLLGALLLGCQPAQHCLLLSLSKPLMCRGQQAPGQHQWVHPGRTPAAAHEGLEDSLREVAHRGGQRAGALGCCLQAAQPAMPVQPLAPSHASLRSRVTAASCYWAACARFVEQHLLCSCWELHIA